MRVDVKPAGVILPETGAKLKAQTVLDYCGGSGGKTLAFAPLMHNTG